MIYRFWTSELLTGKNNLKTEHFFDATKSSSAGGHGCGLRRKR